MTIFRYNDRRVSIKVGTKTLFIHCTKMPVINDVDDSVIEYGEYTIEEGEDQTKVQALSFEQSYNLYKAGYTSPLQQAQWIAYPPTHYQSVGNAQSTPNGQYALNPTAGSPLVIDSNKFIRGKYVNFDKAVRKDSYDDIPF